MEKRVLEFWKALIQKAHNIIAFRVGQSAVASAFRFLLEVLDNQAYLVEVRIRQFTKSR